ncbi:formylglycine-generating enzyme family protein [Chelatococcus sambhunathii]|uniref:Formylglycine-generating enzyme family protein n=1 Tax=Chelatococcus sambhunathii TaxID=363953 RepID=A0ABU1DAJ4_9HYPH|nr:formylglycine-generating enzyme family protein [Chelatococcus sambhunathii]MDR4305122.1 formylglycine-generating enzyme family protein [Chelatococcus sambhunathii]
MRGLIWGLFAIAVLTAAAGLAAGGATSGHATGAASATAGATSATNDRLCAAYSGLPGPSAAGAPSGMVWIPGGSFLMGSSQAYPEEAPRREASVGGFWIDRHEVTNAQFAAFVAATGYKTVAERGLSKEDYPDLPPEALVPGAMVFYEPPKGAPARADVAEWWRYVPGANWRNPTGPGSSIAGKENRPVVQIGYADAKAYADWLGRALPTEAEWEFAARGGLNGAEFAWGDEQTPHGQWMANSWQGFFPYEDDALDGYHGAAPVGCFPPNGYGLYDMIGNVWEWATDWYLPGHRFAEGERDPKGPTKPQTTSGGASRVIKGGSWLCSPNFCLRYRPSARQPQEADLGASHVGFRTVLRAPGPAGAR